MNELNYFITYLNACNPDENFSLKQITETEFEFYWDNKLHRHYKHNTPYEVFTDLHRGFFKPYTRYD